MTRRSDLMLEDLRGCNHEMTIPISENGEILYWRCTCGERRQSVEQIQEDNRRKNP